MLSFHFNRRGRRQTLLFRTFPGSRSFHDKDRAERMFYDSLGGAAEKQPRNCPSPVRSNDDQVNIEMFCHQNDLIKRISHAQVRLDVDSPF